MRRRRRQSPLAGENCERRDDDHLNSFTRVHALRFRRGASPRGDDAHPPFVIVMAATLSKFFPFPKRDIAPPRCSGDSRLPLPPVGVTLRGAVDILP